MGKHALCWRNITCDGCGDCAMSPIATARELSRGHRDESLAVTSDSNRLDLLGRKRHGRAGRRRIGHQPPGDRRPADPRCRLPATHWSRALPAGRPAPPADRTCCGPAAPRATGRPAPDPPPTTAALRSTDENHQIGLGEPLSGQLDAGPLDGVAAGPQSGRVAQFHRPAVDGRGDGDGVAGGAGRGMNDRPAVARQGVDQAALAHVDPAGQHHAPRLDQMPAQVGPRQQRVDLSSRRRRRRRGRSPAGFRPARGRARRGIGPRGWRRCARCGRRPRPQARRPRSDRRDAAAAQSRHATRRQPAATSDSSIIATAASPP